MRYSTRFLIMFPLTLLLPAVANAQHYTYEGTITFLELSGKDCGEVKVGDSRPYTLAVGVQGAHITGYSLLQGADPGRFSGTGTGNLSVEYPDPLQSTGHGISLLGLASTSLTGELRERKLRSDEAGCNLSRGQIVTQQIASGQASEAIQQGLAQNFQSAQQEYAAKQRNPQAYDEMVQLLPELAQVEAQGSAQFVAILRLREKLQPLLERVYGAESTPIYTNLNTQARLHEQLKEFDMALQLREKTYQLAKRKFLQSLSVAAYNLGDVLENLGRKEEALAAFAEATQLDEKQYGQEHPEVASDLERQAQLLEALKRQSQAVALYQRILVIREKTPDAKVENIEQARNQLARSRDPQAYAKLEQFSAELGQAKSKIDLKLAVALRLQIRPLAEKCYGKPSRYLADLLINQADDLETLNRDQEALELYPQALAISEASYGKDHLKVALVLNNYGYQLNKMGRYQEVLPLYQRALSIRETLLGSEHADAASSLYNLARLYEILGQYDNALPLYQRALAINEKLLGLEHNETATSLNNLALLYQTIGQYGQALPLYHRALAIKEKVLGPEHAGTATSLHNLAFLYTTLGQYDKALPLYQRALAIKEKVLGPEHVGTASSLNNLAELYRTLGQYDKALPLYQRALAIHEKVLGPEHPNTATSLNNLALLYEAVGQYDKALPLKQRAVSISENVLGSNHADTAQSLNNLAALYDTLGQYSQALPLYQRALAIREKVLGPEHVGTAETLNNIAFLYHQALGQYDQALPLYQRALVVREKALGPEHVETANSINNIAFIYGEQHHSTEALRWFERGQTVTDHVIQNTFPILTEQQKLKFVEMKAGEMHGMLSLIHRQLSSDQSAIRAGLDLVLSRKGIVFDAQARQQDTIARSLDPETKRLWDALSNQRGELAKLMQNKPEKMSGEDYQKRIADYQSAITQLEGQLASKSALIAQDLKQRQITSKEVAAQLGNDGALVEYTKIQDYDWDHGKWSTTWRYLAFIMHGDGKIQMIDLGEADKLESTVQAALKPIGLVSSAQDRQQEATRTLHQTLWQPITAAVGDANQIVFSPDGLLNLVPFAAMQDDNGHYLIESRQISYVTSGRDLTKGDLGIKPQTELYLAANPQFDLAVQSSPTPASEEPTRGTVRSAGFGLHFSPLPGTAQEAEQIPSYLQGKHTVLTGKAATEDAVLHAKRPRVMHLSTHGFFLADQAAITQGTRGAARIDSDQPHAPASALPKGYENPLVRSGLAFAGANHASEAKDGRDGLLTALEVSGMDLHGTDLVTLSACETGRGEVKSGEGVFGLRRAFALAGTAHLMMSLWPVSDDVTAQQMQRFYQLYGKKTNPAAALRQAQLATIAELRSKKGQAEPALWAPFIVQGW